MTCGCNKYKAPLKTMVDIKARCDAESEIAATLYDVSVSDWRTVRKCSVWGE